MIINLSMPPIVILVNFRKDAKNVKSIIFLLVWQSFALPGNIPKPYFNLLMPNFQKLIHFWLLW